MLGEFRRPADRRAASGHVAVSHNDRCVNLFVIANHAKHGVAIYSRLVLYRQSSFFV